MSSITPGWQHWPDGYPRKDNGIAYNTYQFWQFIVQSTLALRERNKALGGGSFPPVAEIWTQGTIESYTKNSDGSYTINCGNVNWSPPPNCSTTRWVSYSCTSCDLCVIPAAYDLVVEPDPTDPFQTVRGLIIGQTWTATNSDGSGTGSLQINGAAIADAITAGYITDLDSIVGQTYYLVRHGSPWQSDRIFDKPDDDSLFKGWNSTGGTSTTWTPSGQTPTDPPTEYSYLLDATGTPIELYTPFGWTPDQWKGKELLVFGGDKLRRIAILGNDDKHLYFTKQAWTAGGCYRVVTPVAVGTPGRKILPIVQFYTGIATQNATHLADDTTGFWDQAAFTRPVFTGDNCISPPTCSNDYPIVLDSDYRYPTDNTCNCGTAGEYLSPNLYKSIRMMQQTCLNMCGSFIDPTKDYSGAGAIPNFCPATYLSTLNINSWTSGYDRNDDGTLTIGGLPSGVIWPRSVYYALIYPLGNISCGSSDLDEDGILSGSFPADDETNPNNNPSSVVLSLGYTRYRPRRLRFLYPKTTWQPNCDNDDGCIDPAGTTTDPDTGALDCFGVGTWIKRPKSNRYMVRGVTGEPSDVGGEFTDRDLSRYVGDNAADTCIVPQIGPDAATALLDSIPFWDRFYRGTLAYKHQLDRDGSRVGTATGGDGQRTLTDTGKNWWSDFTNGSFTQKSRASITSVVPYTPATLTTPEVYGSATTPVTPPRPVVESSWVVTDDTDASGSGNVLLTGTYGFTSSASTVTIPGEFMSSMVGKTITFTYHGAQHVESGTATGGSSSTLIDTTKDTADHSIQTGCWWDAGRFTIGYADGSGSGSGSGVGGAYVDFILTIIRNSGGSGSGSGSGSQQEWRVPITGVTNHGAGGVVVHFNSIDGMTIQSGDVYSISEPAYEINKWEDRYCSLTSPDGTAYEGHISHSDDVTLFFDSFTLDDGTPAEADVSIGAGWTYVINELMFGSVLRWSDDDQRWDYATGDDEVRPFVIKPEPFKADPRYNLEDILKDYGTVMPDDIGSEVVFKELYWSINLLHWTKVGCSWRSRYDPNTPEFNSFTATSANSPNYEYGPQADPNPSPPEGPNNCVYDQGGCANQSDAQGAAAADISQAAARGTAIGGGTGYSGGGSEDTCPDATASGKGANKESSTFSEVSGAPYKSSTIDFHEEGNGTNWIGVIDDDSGTGQYAYAVASGLPTYINSSIDFYNFADGDEVQPWTFVETINTFESTTYFYAGAANDGFKPSGDQVTYQRWTKWSSATVDDTGTAVSDKLGSTTLIDLPSLADPTPHPSTVDDNYFQIYGGNFAGYNVTGVVGIVKWDFQYVGPTS